MTVGRILNASCMKVACSFDAAAGESRRSRVTVGLMRRIGLYSTVGIPESPGNCARAGGRREGEEGKDGEGASEHGAHYYAPASVPFGAQWTS